MSRIKTGVSLTMEHTEKESESKDPIEVEAPDTILRREEAEEDQGIFGEIWDFLKVRKRFWLAPIILALILLGFLFLFAGQAGVVSPFVYAL